MVEAFEKLSDLLPEWPMVVLLVVVFFVMNKMHCKERVDTQKNFETERLAVQENFKQFLEPHSKAQHEVATALTKLSESVHEFSGELDVMIVKNSAEHNEIIRLVSKP